MDKNLTELLDEKRRASEERGEDFQHQREQWLDRLNALYKEIEGWLYPAREKGHLSITYRKIPLMEDLLGRYEAPVMRIQFYNGRFIDLTPAGLHVIGARGRVDIDFGDRDVAIVGNMEDEGWTFAERKGRHYERFPFNQESFEALLSDFVEKF